MKILIRIVDTVKKCALIIYYLLQAFVSYEAN